MQPCHRVQTWSSCMKRDGLRIAGCSQFHARRLANPDALHRENAGLTLCFNCGKQQVVWDKGVELPAAAFLRRSLLASFSGDEVVEGR